MLFPARLEQLRDAQERLKARKKAEASKAAASGEAASLEHSQMYSMLDFGFEETGSTQPKLAYQHVQPYDKQEWKFGSSKTALRAGFSSVALPLERFDSKAEQPLELLEAQSVKPAGTRQPSFLDSRRRRDARNPPSPSGKAKEVSQALEPVSNLSCNYAIIRVTGVTKQEPLTRQNRATQRVFDFQKWLAIMCRQIYKRPKKGQMKASYPESYLLIHIRINLISYRDVKPKHNLHRL